MSKNRVWRNRWEGTPSNTPWNLDEFPSVESLRVSWADEEAKLMAFVVNLPEEKLSNRIEYISNEGCRHERVLWECMAHVVNHGTQRKTEAAATLTGFGHSPGDIDLIVYLNEVLAL